MTNTYIPSIEKETAGGIREITLATETFSNRTIYLFGSITDETLYSFTMQLLHLMQDEGEIKILINSPGGEVNAGLAIYDLIQSCKTPLKIYCVGRASSMGAIILAGGQKGRRYILPHSEVMVHEPLIPNGVGGTATSIKSISDSILKTRELLNGILAKHTGRSIEDIDKATDHDNYMTANEAVDFGLCDEIVEEIK